MSSCVQAVVHNVNSACLPMQADLLFHFCAHFLPSSVCAKRSFDERIAEVVHFACSDERAATARGAVDRSADRPDCLL
jgi:hypothetical protein